MKTPKKAPAQPLKKISDKAPPKKKAPKKKRGPSYSSGIVRG